MSFSPDYLRCAACETLVVAHAPDPQALRVTDDDRDFYGRQYYESHLVGRYGYPKLTDRARTDLPERCLHWLRAALQFKLPPGRALELGCAHGGFVALLKWAGFEARGLELSPWLVGFGRETFGVPILQGPIEEQSIDQGSLDLIALMDVLEHLGDPLATMRHCLDLLQPDGIFLIQTPCYREGATFEEMVSRADPFLGQFKPEQHLFLFSRSSIRRFFECLGLSNIDFLPAIFSHYDMFLAAGRLPFVERTPDEIRERLLSTASGRIVDALIEKDDELAQARRRSVQWEANCAACEADRAARREVIEQQGRQLGEVQEELKTLRSQAAAVEAESAARLDVIEQQGRHVGEVEAERNNLRYELADLRSQFELSEADRTARLDVIQRQGRQLGEAQGELKALRTQAEAAEAEHAALLNLTEQQKRQLGELEAECNLLRIDRQDLRQQLQSAEEESAARLDVIEQQGRHVGEVEAERNNLRYELADLRRHFELSEADRTARLDVIQRQGRQLGELEAERNTLRAELEDLNRRCNRAEADSAALRVNAEQHIHEIAGLQKQIAAQNRRLESRTAVLNCIQKSSAYRLLRRIGFWKVPEEIIDTEV